jgi:hypothetical protein
MDSKTKKRPLKRLKNFGDLVLRFLIFAPLANLLLYATCSVVDAGGSITGFRTINIVCAVVSVVSAVLYLIIHIDKGDSYVSKVIKSTSKYSDYELNAEKTHMVKIIKTENQ